MGKADLPGLRRLFERCLEQPQSEREALARQLCQDHPDLLDELLALLRRDRKLDQAGVLAESGLARLRQLALPDAVMQGRRVGPFQVEACIGSGGMGSIYRARRVDGKVDQQVALKLLRPTMVNPALLERFSNERRVLASLNHPGICRFLDAGQLSDGQPYVVMELIDGTPLLTYCDRHRLSLRERLGLFKKVLQAVAYAHSHLVVHRDIKSGNVLVTPKGEPRLLDFGIAKSLNPQQPELTQTVERYLTPASAAPEQYLGEPVGTACDIYALGQLLYELACGLPPFEFAGATAGQVERMLLEQPPPPPGLRCLAAPAVSARARGFASPAELRRYLSGDLETIILKCLRKQPAERYASVEQLEQEISRLLEHRPIMARRGERWYRLQKFITRNRLPVGLGAALALTLSISLGVILAQTLQVNEERDRAVMERDRAQHAVDVLRQAFVAADPARALGGEVTARQILQSAREPLDPLFDSQPDLFASLATVLAEVKLDLMLNDPAALLAERGLEAARRAGMPDADMRQLWLLLARASTDSHNRDSAREALDRVQAMDDSPQPDWLHAWGRWLLLGNRPEQAMEYLLKAVDLSASDSVPVDIALRARSQLGLAQSLAGHHHDSLDTFEQLLKWLTAEMGADHSQVTLTRFRRIDALRRADQLEQARTEAMAVKNDVIEWYGPESAMAGRVHGSLGLLHHALGDLDAAAGHTRQSHDIWLAALGPDHPNVLRAAINLAQQLEGIEHRSAEAGPWYRTALNVATTHFGADNPTSLTIRAHLARHLARQDRGEDAIQLLTEAAMPERIEASPMPSWQPVYNETLELAGCIASGGPKAAMPHCPINPPAAP